MLTPERITTVAKNAAHVAYTVLGLDCPYSVQIIDRRELPFDCLLRDRDNTIQLNLSHLEPFSQSVMPASDLKTEEDYELDENYRHTMKICSVVFHEMRHLYKKRAVEIYPRTPELRKQRPKKMRILCPKFYSARSLAICRIASCFSGDSLRYHVSSSTSLGFVMVF